MRAVVLEGGFGLEHVGLVDRPGPAGPLGSGRVRVRLRAASLNYRDLMMITGRYNPRQPLPLVPCSDGAGEIVAIGEGVDRVAVGDRVATCFTQGWMAGDHDPRWLGRTLGGPLDGVLQDEIELDQDGVIALPTHLSFEEGATLPCAALTAWSALVTLGGIKAGDSILALGTGGVSTFALQFGQALGARVIVGSSTPQKRAEVERRGAAATFDSRGDPRWGRTVRGLTGGRGVDLVVEVGGAGTLAQSLDAVRTGGTVAMIGVLAGASAPLDMRPVLMRQIRIQGVFTGHRASFEAMNRAISLHRIQPHIHQVFPLEEIRAAFSLLESGAHQGKICLSL